jgi:DNA-binding CsgD family transcriptional regulator
MQLTHSETSRVLLVLTALNGDEDAHTRRVNTGNALLRLFGAEYFASFHWNEERRRFEDGVSINMSADNLARYDRYFQFRDPITLQMQRLHRAVGVNEIMTQNDFVRTEFYNDFIRCDGLYYGINLHVYDGDFPIADWRIWRKRNCGNFDRRSLAILDFLAPHLRNATLVERLSQRRDPTAAKVSATTIRETTSLSVRESQIAYHAFLGQEDAAIASVLCISIPTVRTHLRHVYRKLSVRNRAELCRRLAFPT